MKRNTRDLIPISGELHSLAVDGIVTSTYEVYDYDSSSYQSDINARVVNNLNKSGLDVPVYYKKYMDIAVEKISSSLSEIGKNGDGFCFITDSHMGWSDSSGDISNFGLVGSLVPEILKRTGICKTIYGGDIMYDYMKDGSDDPRGEILRVNEMFDELTYSSSSSYGIFLQSKGDHDFRVSPESGGQEFMLPNQDTRNLIMPKMSRYCVVANEEASGCYFYYDDDVNCRRYIVVDTHDGVNSNTYVIGDEQLKWIANVALMTNKEGYDVVVISHVSLFGVTSAEKYDAARNVIKAFNKKKSVVVGD